MLGNIRAPRGEGPPMLRCHRCRGFGRSACEICRSTGQVLRGVDRLGKPMFDRCNGCYGTRSSRCAHCGGGGFIEAR